MCVKMSYPLEVSLVLLVSGWFDLDRSCPFVTRA